MDWNGEWDHDGIGANHGKPKVAFMVNPKFATKEIELRTFGKDDYDKAKAWQMSFLKTPKEEVEAKYGKGVSKAPASLIIEAGNAKEGKIHNLANTTKTIDKIEEALQEIVNGDVPENALGGELKTALENKSELSKDVFTQLNLIKAEDKTAIKQNNITGATEILSINYSLYKTGTADRKTLLEAAKLSQKGYGAVARNAPDYITDEGGTSRP